MKPRTEISMQLYQMMLERGYPENLCELVTRNLNTDFTATRMIGYLSHYSHLPEVEVVDEMLAILSDRNQIMRKKAIFFHISISEAGNQGNDNSQIRCRFCDFDTTGHVHISITVAHLKAETLLQYCHQ